jgi:hypothetical protein
MPPLAAHSLTSDKPHPTGSHMHCPTQPLPAGLSPICAAAGAQGPTRMLLRLHGPGCQPLCSHMDTRLWHHHTPPRTSQAWHCLAHACNPTRNTAVMIAGQTPKPSRCGSRHVPSQVAQPSWRAGSLNPSQQPFSSQVVLPQCYPKCTTVSKIPGKSPHTSYKCCPAPDADVCRGRVCSLQRAGHPAAHKQCRP